MSAKFDLGVIVVTVNTKDGQKYAEDWDKKDADTAKCYANETSFCGDVSFVRYENTISRENLRIEQGKVV